MAAMDTMPVSAMMKLHERMMADAAIRRRVRSDTTMRRMMNEMIDHMPADHQAMMRRMMAEPMPAMRAGSARAKTSGKKPHIPKKKSAADSSKKSTAHDKMPGMKMPPQR
ncbi:MAG: hypothetical protein M3081_17790 [Gemmatimonadota bacterium]|nr:hypothetical protein [Gemmatimonadota bacterium]